MRDIYFSQVWGLGSLRLGCQRSWDLLRAQSLVCRQPPAFSLGPHMGRERALVLSSSCKGTSPLMGAPSSDLI